MAMAVNDMIFVIATLSFAGGFVAGGFSLLWLVQDAIPPPRWWREASIGYGDNILATGFARGAAARGKRVQFGDGKKAIWDQRSAPIFAGNPNIAPKEARFLDDPRIEWVHFYRGNRLYNQIAKDNSHWIWNYDFRAIPGELFFSKDELRFGEKVGNDFVLVEPNLPPQKKSSPNKDWGFPKYIALVDRLKKAGLEVAQLVYAEGRRLPGVKKVHTPNFRLALAALRQAQIYVGPEGGLHHASAALGVKATVLFGGFVPPQVTGYEFHTNLTGGAEACGSITPCAHCKAAMAKIDVDEVFGDVLSQLGRTAWI
jgi:hypothetical protein